MKITKVKKLLLILKTAGVLYFQQDIIQVKFFITKALLIQKAYDFIIYSQVIQRNRKTQGFCSQNI